MYISVAKRLSIYIQRDKDYNLVSRQFSRFCHPFGFQAFLVLELGIRECGSVLSKAGGSLHREGACPQASLPSFPRLLGTGEERGLVGAEASKEFPNRKTNGCGGPRTRPGVPWLPGP